MSKYDEDEIQWSDEEDKIFDTPSATRDGASASTSTSTSKANGKAVDPSKSSRAGVSHVDAEEAREAALQQELENVRKINTVVEGVVESLEKAKGNMEVSIIDWFI